MKKVLLIMHGLPRPTIEDVKKNADHLIENSLKKENIIIDTLFSSWNCSFFEKDVEKIIDYKNDIDYIKNNFDYYLVENSPSLEEVISIFQPPAQFNNEKWKYVTPGIYHLYKKMLLIAELYKEKKYDYYVFCRTDLKIKINFDYEKISFNVLDPYWIPHNFTDFFNDHFFICNYDLFHKVFSDINIKEISELSKNCHNPEQLLKNVISRNVIADRGTIGVESYRILRQCGEDVIWV